MKEKVRVLFARAKGLPNYVYNLFVKNPQLKDWIQILATISALIISAYSFRNSIENSKKAEKTYIINLHKDSLVVKNLEDINRNTKSQTEIIIQQLKISEQQFKVSELGLDEQVRKGTPLFSLIQDKVLHIDSLVFNSYLLEIETMYEFTGTRTAYNVEFRMFIIVNNSIMPSTFDSNTIIDVIPNKIKTGYINCHYGNRAYQLQLVTEVKWIDRFLNKSHSNTMYSEYDKLKKIFFNCDSNEEKVLFNKMNIYLKESGMHLLKPNS